jgi:hypothetical protein
MQLTDTQMYFICPCPARPAEHRVWTLANMRFSTERPAACWYRPPACWSELSVLARRRREACGRPAGGGRGPGHRALLRRPAPRLPRPGVSDACAVGAMCNCVHAHRLHGQSMDTKDCTGHAQSDCLPCYTALAVVPRQRRIQPQNVQRTLPGLCKAKGCWRAAGAGAAGSTT